MPQTEWENLASLLSIAVAAVALLGMLALRGSPPRRIEDAFRRLANVKSLCFVLIPALSFALNIGIAFHRGIPRPLIHDEFSYLLAGDTFAHGRLTNPSPPFLEHFETPQELMRPTRMSKYPPGQGLFIALGQVLTGMPVVGIWISTAAACAAIYWMLLGFVSRPWALLGGMMAAASPTLLDWSQVYWGGNVAVLGGAMLLGAWGRLMVRTTISASVIMCVGLAILANSRPFEGMMAALPLLIGLLINARHRLTRIMIPAVIVLGLAGTWMGYYNHRVTGNPLRMPFMEYTAQYDVYPKFWFQPLRPRPEYRNRSQQWVHADFEKGQYDELRTLKGFLGIAPLRAGGLISDNLKLGVLLAPLMAAFFLLRDMRIRWLFVSVGTLLVGLWCENFDLPHYSAPVNPVLWLLVSVGMERLWRWSRALAPSRGTPGEGRGEGEFERGTVLDYRQRQPELHKRPIGELIVLAVMIGFTAGAAMCMAEGVPRDSQIVDQGTLVNDYRELQTGRHIIFVRYGPNTELINGFANEYVYNPADLDGSRIIWARWFGPRADQPVAGHFSGRSVWILDVGGKLVLNRYLEQH